MISTNEFKTGMTINYEGNLFQIIEFLHVKPGKGPAFVRTKLRNLRTGSVIDNTFNAGVKVERAHVEKSSMQFLYTMGDVYVFMNNETYDQIEIPESNLEHEKKFLLDGMPVKVMMFESEILGVELPEKVTLEVTEAEAGVKGNTASNVTKRAVLETGYGLQVPMFIDAGEKIVVNTNTGEYDSRAK